MLFYLCKAYRNSSKTDGNKPHYQLSRKKEKLLSFYFSRIKCHFAPHKCCIYAKEHNIFVYFYISLTIAT